MTPEPSPKHPPNPRSHPRPRRLLAWLAPSLIAVTVLVLPAVSRADTLLEDAVSFGGSIFHLQTGVPGLVVAAIRDGDTAIAGFGETQRGNGQQPDGNTVLRIGSITKVFTGQMLAHAATRAEARMTDPIAPYLQGDLATAMQDQPPIRFIDLVTHSGGLPRELPRQPGPDGDPYATLTHAAFADWLRQNRLDYPPGQAIAYSNFGFDLLAAALSGAGRDDYTTLVQQRLLDPLGLTDTRFALTPDMAGRLMTGHAPDGSALPDIPSGVANAGSGGLRSTARDMLRWMAWHLSDDGPDPEVRLLDHAAYVSRAGKRMVLSMDESGRMDEMGLGWVVMYPHARQPRILQKAGALQGQMSLVMLAPERKAGVFVSINQYDFAAAYAMAGFAAGLLDEIATD